MPISVPGTWTPDRVRYSRSPRGFTILEILVVIAVISVVTSTILLNTRLGNPETQLKQHASTLAKTMKLLLQEAILNDENYALALVPGGFKVLVFDGEGFTPSKQRFFTSLQKQHAYSDELVVDNSIVAIEDKQEPDPHILFLSSGEMSVIQWQIQDRDNQLNIQLNSNLLGDIQIAGPTSELL
ncbi:MAG: prepilin-type N-terminal cleavage/methylation domain-containing protein [Gammaproteobacteria bacterium]|nr:prepilin-type N-terminal cleavage/methylation domain-containing protein [Gammaproteobacteria bacterium]